MFVFFGKLLIQKTGFLARFVSFWCYGITFKLSCIFHAIFSGAVYNRLRLFEADFARFPSFCRTAIAKGLAYIRL